MSEHPLDTGKRREAAAVAAVADALDRLRRRGCLGPARFWHLAAGTECAPDELRHLLICGHCRSYTVRVAAAVEGGPEPAAWASLTARVRSAALACRTALELLPKEGDQGLSFRDDPHLVAACSTDRGGARWIDVAHPLLAPGVPLVLVLDQAWECDGWPGEGTITRPGVQTVALRRRAAPRSLGTPQGQAPTPWKRVVMLREGPRGAAARVRVDAAFAGGQFLQVRRFDLEDVAALAQAEDLRTSFQNAVKDDPPGLPHWQSWAREALALSGIAAGVGSLLEEVARRPLTLVAGCTPRRVRAPAVRRRWR
jgi:hypothetical protein